MKNYCEWQPINTAPRDGARILVYGKVDGSDQPSVEICRFHGGGWLTDLVILGDDDVRLKPTHWIPLPCPPDEGTVLEMYRP